MRWFAKAPSNIALIKYMGKDQSTSNLPSNPSLSYTLPHLYTTVEIELSSGKQDYWEPLILNEHDTIKLSEHNQTRFLKHFQNIKRYFNCDKNFIVRSTNNFPLSAGLASSASSFCALTRCASIALSALTNQECPSLEQQSTWSRTGSGSSCRSFFQPWALWEAQHATSISLPYEHLLHQVILIETSEKKVSSSQAHELIQTSPHFQQRPERARNRLSALLTAFNNKNWQVASQLCYEEFQDMHQLFHTAKTPFYYINDKVNEALEALQDIWKKYEDGPIITMDAGPNIHLLYRPDQTVILDNIKHHFLGKYHVL